MPHTVTSPQPHTPHTMPSPQPPMSAACKSVPTKKQESCLPRSNSAIHSCKTKTFHLVHNPSAGATQHTGQSIIVVGKQWDVVGGGAQHSKSKKDKDDARQSNAEPEQQEPKQQEQTGKKVCTFSLTTSRSPLTHYVVKVSDPSPSKSNLHKVCLKESSSSCKHSSPTESRDGWQSMVMCRDRQQPMTMCSDGWWPTTMCGNGQPPMIRAMMILTPTFWLYSCWYTCTFLNYNAFLSYSTFLSYNAFERSPTFLTNMESTKKSRGHGFFVLFFTFYKKTMKNHQKVPKSTKK